MSDNRVICANGHYYDGSKYDKCPHCAEGMARIEPSVFAIIGETDRGKDKEEHKKPDKKGFLFHKKKDDKQQLVAAEANRSNMTEKMPESGNTKEHNMSPELQDVAPAVDTEAIEQTDLKKSSESKPVLQSVSPLASAPQSIPASHSQGSLSDAFAQATAPQKQVTNKDKTIGFFSTGGNMEPPVGYLICTAGEDWGTGYPLKSGNNAIGRGQTLDVVIMDPKVSREKQAFVMYEPKGRKFFVRPGEGSGLCYLNGELVMAPLEIQQFDRITLGDTELMLIAVCCEKFSWEETKNEE